MMDFLSSLETSGFSRWVLESGSLWAFPTILLLHTIGMGFLVGANTFIDLRLLGIARRVPIRPLEKCYPVIWASFWVNAISGTVLFVADATAKAMNPVFYFKLVFVFVAMFVLQRIRKEVLASASADVEGGAVSTKGKVLAMTSLVLWTAAITTGRLLAYTGAVAGLREH